MQKFNKIDPSIPMSLVNQESKDNSGVVVFAMIQTLHRNPELIKPFDLIVIDEAHHVVAESYLKVIKLNKAFFQYYIAEDYAQIEQMQTKYLLEDHLVIIITL